MNNGIHAIIETPEVSKDLTLNQSAWRSDNSFGEKLKIEQQKLEESRLKTNSITWAAVQSVFNAVPLEFEFNISSMENNFNTSMEQPTNKIEGTAKQNGLSNQNNGNERNATENQSFISAVPQTSKQDSILNKLLTQNMYFAPNIEVVVPFSKFAEAARSSLKLDLDPIIESISKFMKISKVSGKTAIELSLKPENLGNILLNISSKNGVVSVEILASEEVKQILEANLLDLKEALAQANINLGSLNVSTGGDQDKEEMLEERTSISLLNLFSPVETEEVTKLQEGSIDRLFALLNELNIYSKA